MKETSENQEQGPPNSFASFASLRLMLAFRSWDLALSDQGRAVLPWGTPTRGQSALTSQPAQSGLRAKQRRRPCQISQ